MPYDRGTEAEAARLVAERAADPDGPISAERMDRGFAVAEARMELPPDCGHEWHGADGGSCPGCGVSPYEAYGLTDPR